MYAIADAWRAWDTAVDTTTLSVLKARHQGLHLSIRAIQIAPITPHA